MNYQLEENYMQQYMEENMEQYVNVIKENETLLEIPEMYSEAAFLAAEELIRFNKEEDKNEWAQRDIKKLVEYEKEFVNIRCYFFYEICLYKKNYQENWRDESIDCYLNELVEMCMVEEQARDLHNWGEFPIRAKIHRICQNVISRISFERLKQYEESDAVFCEQIRRIEERYAEVASLTGMGNWLRRVEVINDFLGLLRNRKWGTAGHLLWICLYLSEIVYYKSGEEINKNYREAVRIDNELLGELYRNFATLQIQRQQLVEHRMMMCYRQTFWPHKDLVEEMRRVKEILGRDMTLRQTFLYQKKEGEILRCYAVLTNGKERWVAISGYDNAKYDLCKTVFDNVSGGGYSVVDPLSYPNTRYMLKSNPYAEYVVEGDREMHWYFKDKCKRMFSCAERRIGNIYLNALMHIMTYPIARKINMIIWRCVLPD